MERRKREHVPIDAKLWRGSETLEGRAVVLDADTLDLGKLFGAHEMAQQAYALAELELQNGEGVRNS